MGSLERDAPEEATLLTQLGALYADGCDLDWASVMSRGQFVPLPSYPWQKKRFWVEGASPHHQWSQTRTQARAIEVPLVNRDDVFELSWEEEAPSTSVMPRPGSRWLVLSNDSTVTARLSAVAERRDIVIECAPIHGEDADDGLRRALNNGPDCVVAVMPTRQTPLDTAWTEVERLVVESSQKLLEVIKAIASRPRPARLWVVTNDAQAVEPGGLSTDPIGSAIWGLLRVAWEEYPEIAGGSIDVTDLDASVAEIIVENLLLETPPRQIAIRVGRTLVPRLKRSASPANGALTLRPDAAYLITGGLGGVGLAIATRLVERGARHLVLAGRHGLPPRERWSQLEPESEIGRRTQGVEALERNGAHIRVVALDVSHQDWVTRTLQALEAEGPAIRGVVHAAAISHDRLIERTSVDELTDVIRSKAGGAWNLQQYFCGRHLDFLVGCSSVAVLFGQAGQASYATANAFLDGLLQRLAGVGQTAISIDWGGWRGVGLAALSGGRQTVETLERDGIISFDTRQGLDAFDYVLGARLARAVVMSVDPNRLIQSSRFAAEPKLFAALVPANSERKSRRAADLRLKLLGR